MGQSSMQGDLTIYQLLSTVLFNVSYILAAPPRASGSDLVLMIPVSQWHFNSRLIS
jgi:hypothetical protein